MTSVSRRIPEGVLERYLAEDLPAQEKARIEVLLAESPLDRARVEELRADSAAFLVRRPPRVLMERLEKAQQRQRWWRWPAVLVPVLAVAAILVVLLRPPDGPDDPIHVKGSVVLKLYQKTATGVVAVSPDVPLVPGDTLGFQVKALAGGFVAIVSKDASGAISVYYPYGGNTSVPYDPQQLGLPVAVELDATLGREDVYALYSHRSFELEWALKALQEGRPLEKAAPKGVSVGHASFTKRAAP